MGWFKLTGVNPSPNTQTANPDDYYGAMGLAGVLTGDSDGHAVRALLEVFVVNGEMRVVALGRRIDGSASQTFAANMPWQEVLPQNEWVFLAATFNFDTGEMALYRNGKPLDGFYAIAGDPWQLAGDPEPDLTTADEPARHQDRRQLPAEHAGTKPVQLPHGRADVLRPRGHGEGGPPPVQVGHH